MQGQPDHQPNEQQQDQAQPLAGIADLQGRKRVGEQVVVQEDPEDRGSQGTHGARNERGDDHRKQIDRRRVGDSEALLEDPDERGCGGKRGDGNEEETPDATGRDPPESGANCRA